jgi:hypothetical protein
MATTIRQTTSARPNSLSTNSGAARRNQQAGRAAKGPASRAENRAAEPQGQSKPKVAKRKAGVRKSAAPDPTKATKPSKLSKRGSGASAGRNASGINKSAFVRSLPATLSAAEVIEKGKTKGIKLSAAQVYTIRANARRRGPEVPDVAEQEVSAAPKGRRAATGKASEAKEAEFIAAALDLGLARAEALIRALRAKASSGWG